MLLFLLLTYESIIFGFVCQKIGLQIKANLENLTNLKPDNDEFRWYLKVRIAKLQTKTPVFISDLLKKVYKIAQVSKLW